ncbi:MAG TPA: sulfatase [Acidobacteriota bacterium]|nr:sulfatase [Acidobacteriota bacterium]
MHQRYLLILPALMLLALASCSGPESAGEKDVVLNLIALQSVARQVEETGEIDLENDDHRYFCLAGGWATPYKLSDEEGSPRLTAAVERETILRYNVVKPADRWLEFTIGLDGKYGSLGKQTIEVIADGQPLEAVEVDAGAEQTKLIHIPTSAQKVGVNSLVLRFAEFTENRAYLTDGQAHEKNPYQGVAGYLHGFRIYLGTSRKPWTNRSDDGTLTFRSMADGRYYNQKANSFFSYAFDIGEGARLRLKGTAKAAMGRDAAVDVAVLARTDEQPEWRQIWQESVEVGKGTKARPFEADIPLDGFSGKTTEFRFFVTTPSRPANERVTWALLQLRTPSKSDAEHQSPPREPIRLAGRVKHVAIIILDALRPDNVGCYGDDRGLTPAIDEFSKEAIRFDNAISIAPYTLASTSSLFTGLLPENHGIRVYRQFFSKELETMPDVFRRNGFYSIAITGHPYISDEHGFSRGFEDVVDLSRQEYWDQNRSTMDEEKLEEGIRMAAEAGKNSFLYIHLAPPHEPYHPPPPFNSRYPDKPGPGVLPKWKIYELYGDGRITDDDPGIQYQRGIYANNVIYADHLAGRIMEWLRKYDLYDDTLIILTADHGEAFMEHGYFGHGPTVYDEMIRIPLLVKTPDAPPGSVAQLVGNLDFFPTLAELFGLEVQDVIFDGRSLAPLFTGQEQKPVDFYYSRSDSSNPVFSFHDRRFKYIQRVFEEYFYDLDADPREKHNIISRYPALAAALRQRGWLILTGEAAAQKKEAELSQEARDQLRHLGYLH